MFFFDVLADLFNGFQTQEAPILEIGTQRGGNLVFLASQFPNGKIVGIDINPPAMELPSGIIFIQGNSESTQVSNIVEDYGPFDLIIEDASHNQKSVFENLKIYGPMLKIGGSFMVEDMQCSVIPGFSRGFFGRKSFSKMYIDLYYKKLMFPPKVEKDTDCYFQARFDPFSLTLRRINRPQVIRFDSKSKTQRETTFPTFALVLKRYIYAIFENKKPYVFFLIIGLLLRCAPRTRRLFLDSVGRKY